MEENLTNGAFGAQSASSIIPVEHRCNCGKLLFKGLVLSSEFEIKCKHCHAINVIGKNSTSTAQHPRYSLLFNLQGRVVNASDSAVPILGWTKAELANMKIQEIFPLLKISTYAHLSNISTFFDIEPFSWETLFQNKHGQFLLAKIHLRYIKSRESAEPLAVFECVQKPDTFIDTLQINNKANDHCKFVSRINTEGVYTYVSIKLSTLLGYPSIEMLGKSITDFYPKKQQENAKQIFARNLALKESFKVSSHTVAGASKSVINFESYFAADLNDKGECRGFQILSWLVS